MIFMLSDGKTGFRKLPPNQSLLNQVLLFRNQSYFYALEMGFCSNRMRATPVIAV
jgi:hypothetical protein